MYQHTTNNTPDASESTMGQRSATAALEAMTSDTSLRLDAATMLKSPRRATNPLHRKTHSSVRFCEQMTILDTDGISLSARSDQAEQEPAGCETKEEVSPSTPSLRNKGASLHVQVLQDARRRQKVEALRDAVLDQQIDFWASTLDEFDAPPSDDALLASKMSSFSMSSNKDLELALLSKAHSLDNVCEALKFALKTELEVWQSE